ncbi:MAG TPA: M67 family metallopeptidase [Anaerolineae bacterium]|nr:M67 family metallopeptidase [Anaerolineae bacterium]
MAQELIRLRKGHWQAMLEHVLRCLPDEACGLLGGEDGEVFLVRPVRNISRNPTRFRMDPGEQIKAMFEIEEKGHQIVAIYHSHPAGPDQPSEIDLLEAAYPEASYLIWYPSGREWNCHAFVMSPEGPEEIPIFLDE